MDALNSSANMNHTNQTDPFSCYSESVLGYRYFAVFWGCCVTITGTLGNLLTVLAFSLDSRLRTRFNVLIVNLAMADLLYCTVLQPISVDSYLHLHWRSGETWCRAFGFLLFVSNAVSIITLCLLAFGRYLLVARRQLFDKLSQNPRKTVLDNFTVLLFFVGLGCVGVFYMLIYKRVKTASKALLKYRISRRSSKKKPIASPPGTDSGVESGLANTSTTDVATIESSDHLRTS
ncbi:hypothetical protein WMY93_031864 [Mugilogobius chulae]|uniref:G-protein coupled receptors family 1 profile domain-containing protein n=1 Tax=Mugilogobius chulae TaxID=88201 RepID=A0AAW0ML08_9GOBI